MRHLPKVHCEKHFQFGGGLTGASALGAAGMVCGPAAIVCVPLGIFLGGIAGAVGAD